MATYKVPQDVEAEDKLLGPFTFRQFIYLLITAAGIAAAYGLSRLFIGLAVIPLPIVLLFGTLALPIRKDQPMEIYLAAIISFYLKPRKRLWDPDGIESLIEITTPKQIDRQLTKDISRGEAEKRFGYLAEIVDSEGWAVRGQGIQAPNSPMDPSAYFAAQQAEDVLDTNNTVSQSFDYMINKSDTKHREETLAAVSQAVATAATPTPVTPGSYNFFAGQTNDAPAAQSFPPATQPVYQPAAAPAQYNDGPTPHYNPYPDDIQQTIIQPTDDPTHMAQQQPAQSTPTTSEKPVSAGIMDLANNTDVSVETLSREAQRLHEKEDTLQEEVVISLR